MTKLSAFVISALLASGISVSAASAPADPEGDPGQPAPVAQPRTVEPTATIGFTPGMKETIRSYYKGKACAREVTKPVAGCVQRRDMSAAPRYSVGKPLPAAIKAEPLPKPLTDALTAPQGYGFGLVDGDVLLLATDNKRVADTFPAVDPQAP